MVWAERNGRMAWCAPDPSDAVLDLRPLSAQAIAGTPIGAVLIAAERAPKPGETLLASAFNQTIGANAQDAVQNALGLPDKPTATTLPDLARELISIHSGTGVICPPLMPDRDGFLQLSLGEIAYREKCPTSGVVFDNILKVLQDT